MISKLYQFKNRVFQTLLTVILFTMSFALQAQTLPYVVANNSSYPDNQVYVAIVGITGGHVWVDPTNGSVHQMNVSDNTVSGPVIGGNTGPGANGKYANCFRKLSDIPNKTINIPKIAGCRILISFNSQLYLYFFGYSGAPSGYSAPNLANPTDPNQGIKFEIVELTYNDIGLWCNTTRVDTYQYPMGLEVWGNGFYKKVGELKTHAQIQSEWQATAPSEFQGLLNTSQGIIHFPTKSSSFPQSLIQGYIDQIWSKYVGQQLVFNAGDAGVWRGNVSGNNFVFRRDSDNQLATIPGKPTTIMAMEASGVMASGAQWDLVVQAQIAAAINRHAIDLNLGSGAMQNFGNSATYYQTWPYNWYAKFWHRSDISVDSKTYAFSFDDVFDQSATIHTPSPTSVKITIGGFAGTVTNGVATFYQNCSYGGYAVSLPVGNYTMANLISNGIGNDDISSLKVNSGYKVDVYWDDNYTGTTKQYSGDISCLVADGWNDKITSLKISSGTATETGVSGLAGTYIIQNRNSNMVMDVANGNAANGTNILQWNNTGATNQQFKLTEVSTGVYSLICVATNKCVDIDGVSTANFANVHEWDYVGGGNQKFKAISAGGGFYKFKATHSNKIIEVGNASTAANANINQYDDNNQTCGQWKLLPVGSPAWSTQIEAENFVAQGGIQTEACSEGGQNVGWIDANDWIVWDVNIPTTTSYNVEYRVASASGGGNLQLEKAGGSPVYGTLGLPNTGGWQTWQTVSHNVNLTVGQQQIAIKALAGGWNINWIKITRTGSARLGGQLDDESTELTYSVFPNPTSDKLNIEGLKEDSKYAIYDISGRPVLQGMLKTYSNQATVDVHELKAGSYFMLVLNSGKTLRFIRK